MKNPEKQMKFDEYIEYVKETCLEIGEEKEIAQNQRTVVTNMLRQGSCEKQIQAVLGITASQVRELIREVQSNVHV